MLFEVAWTVRDLNPFSLQLLCACRAQAGLRDAHPGYQPGRAQGQEGPAAVPPAPDQQRSLHQAQQGHHQHA